MTIFAVFFSSLSKSIERAQMISLFVSFYDIFSTTSVAMNPSEIEELDIQETYHNIPFISKLDYLDNCPNVNPKDVRCAKFLISKLHGKASHIVTFSWKEYKVNFDGLKKKLGHFRPHHMECFLLWNMLGLLRLNLDGRILLRNRTWKMCIVKS